MSNQHHHGTRPSTRQLNSGENTTTTTSLPHSSAP